MIEYDDCEWDRRRCYAALFIFVAISLAIILTILIICDVFRPQKPTFTLEDATIFNLNVSSPSLISVTVQVTVRSRNPSPRSGIYYSSLTAYAVYNSQQITYYTHIPPVYQDHEDTNVWSPILTAVDVPVAPYNGAALDWDKSDGAISLAVKINGRFKWRIGSIVTRWRHLHVTCPASIPIGKWRSSGIPIGNAINYQLSENCIVDV